MASPFETDRMRRGQRRNDEGYEDTENIPDNSSLRAKTSHNQICRLETSLTIIASFENVEALKRTVREALDFPATGKFVINFKSHSLMPALRMSTCKFEIVTNNEVIVAEKCVEDMAGRLRDDLKTVVDCKTYRDKNGNEQVKELCSSEPQGALSKLANKENSHVGKGKKIQTMIIESGNISDKVEEPDRLNQIKSFTESTAPKDVLFEDTVNCKQISSECRAGVSHPDGNYRPAVPNRLKIPKIFTNPTQTIEDHDEESREAQNDGRGAECATFPDKSNASNKSKNGSETFSSVNSIDESQSTKKLRNHETWNTSGNKMLAWRSRIENVLSKIEEKKSKVLVKHDDKIAAIKSDIRNLEEKEVEWRNKAEKDAVVDKLAEACSQRMEFVCKCNILSIKVQDLKPSITAEQELYRVQEDFGVECKRLTNALPIYARRDDIVNHVKSNQVSIILGETGSGKSTQIAQYLYEAGINVCGDGGGRGMIVCTQPRKVAAVQLADRVAQEMVVVTGDLVGCKTGNKRKMNDNTKIVFMTDHSLLNECLEDRDFLKYSCIIVDEAHERSIYTDILLGMIKACLNRRPDLRVIITSATIDPQVFIDYFQCPKEISVSGRTFPVEVFYMESTDDFENYETKAVRKAAEIHRTQPAGDILVFLTSPVEIQRCCEEFCKTFEDKDDFKCLPLHGQLLPEEQKEVFDKLNEGVRKVVFATNCAETSITIDGIKYVIDTGVFKEMRYDAKKSLNLLGVHMISQSSANQRKGRAGRTASGKCYRLFSEEGYNQMRTINEPEILRVHLGQAVLKLAELGVNIRDYDFVESPSDSALQAALETLEFLGAIGNEKITDLGRWISKLPFDPKLGYIVYKAKDEELLYDAIVLASVVSNGSGLFYRGLTETEAQISARCKVEFGLESGDIFTWFAIYKMWEAIPAIQEKRRWCKFNCINNKSMTYTKACIDEVIPTLNREMRLDVVKQFSGEPSSVTVLSKLMLRAYGLSLCHFMGHSRAGYFSLESQRQVHLHPSSTLVAQNLQPEWLVFVELVKTSREFIKGILVVNEDWIQDAVDEEHLSVDIAKAKEQTLSVVHKEEVGMSVFKAMVGPRYSGIQSWEQLCEAHGMKHSILEADRELGTVTIYSSSTEIHPGVLNKLKEVKSDTVLTLQEEESECRFLNKESNDPPNIRAVMGSGACVRQVLMPHQTAEVLLRKVGDATEEDIILKFSEFGTIVRIISFKSVEPWGFIRYCTIDEAAVACERTKQDQRMAGSPKLDRGSMNARNVLQAKVAWIRRPVKGKGMAFIKCDPMDKADLVGKSIFINGGFQSLKPSKKRETFAGPDDSSADFVVHNIGNTVEETLRQLIVHGILNGDNVNLKVTILREKVPIPTHKELEDMKVRLKSYIDPDGVENFNIRLIAPKPSHVHHIGFLYFNDPVRGLRVCQRQNRRINMASEPVIITPTLRTTIIVPKKIKDVCEEEMNDLFIEMKRDLGVDLEWKPLKEDFAINIKCENPEGSVKARERITEKLKGDPIDCNEDKSRLCLLTTAGQCLITQTQQNTGCLIISDKRTKIIHLYGKIKQVSDAKNQINAYVEENKDKREMIIRLKSFGKPPGLMKSLMTKFGPLLDGLIRDYKLSSVSLDCRSHTLKCLGSEESVQALDVYISTLQNELFKSHPRAGIILKGNNGNNYCLPECVVCMDDVESKEDLYRLEACGHPYCVPCLQHQTLACVQSNQFPLVCAQENCGKELVWKDVRYIFTNNWIAEEKLVNSSLNHLVSTQPEKFKFCPTPNCSVVYKVTVDDEGDGCEFNCAACFASTCSSCHVAFHTGVTCKMAKSGSGAEGQLNQWVAEDPKKRKICPGCNVPIEKIFGCNKMHCTGCHTIFCWICRERFPSEGSCYDHLTKHHSGIFDFDAN